MCDVPVAIKTTSRSIVYDFLYVTARSQEATLWRRLGSGGTNRNYLRQPRLRDSHRPPSLFCRGEERTFGEESAETSINSYCQDQAAPEKNITCPNERLVSDYWSEVWRPHLKGFLRLSSRWPWPLRAEHLRTKRSLERVPISLSRQNKRRTSSRSLDNAPINIFLTFTRKLYILHIYA